MFGLGSRRPSAKEVAIRAYALKHIVAGGLSLPPRDFLDGLLANLPTDDHRSLLAELEQVRKEQFGRLGRWQAKLSPKERAFAEAPLLEVTPRQHIDATWRLEAFQVLLWALSLVESLPRYDIDADDELLKTYPPGDIDSFTRAARLRPRAETDHERDMAELWHWRSRTRQLVEEGRPLDSKRSYDDIVRSVAAKAGRTGEIGQITDEDFTVGSKAYRDIDDDEWARVRSITVERHFTLNWICGYSPGNRWDDTPTDT